MTRFIRGLGPAEWKFVLPLPPSANNSYPTVYLPGGKSRRVSSAGLKKFREASLRALMTQKRPPEPIRGKFVAHFRCQRQRGDINNREKHAVDVLVRAGIIQDDRQMEGGTHWWDDEIEGCTLTIEVL